MSIQYFKIVEHQARASEQIVDPVRQPSERAAVVEREQTPDHAQKRSEAHKPVLLALVVIFLHVELLLW